MPTPSKVQLSGGAFQDPAGNVLANGYLLMSLSQDGQISTGQQIAAGRELKINLDQNGNVDTTTTQYVWPNDVINPSNTFYNVSAYTSAGQLVWGPNAQQVFSTPSPYDVSVWIPGSVSLIPPPLPPPVYQITVQPTYVYDIGCYYPGTIANASALMTLVPLERSVTFAVALTPSKASCGTAPTNTAVITLYKNGVQFGTLTFAAGSTTGVFASSTGAAFVAGDILTVKTPSSVDGALADVGFILSGVLTP